MRSRALVLVVIAAGCASTPQSTNKTWTQVAIEQPLVERAAALFNAAVHNDRLRLRTMIDWPRYRLVQASANYRDEASAARFVAELEAEPEPGEAYIDQVLNDLCDRLVVAAAGPIPPSPTSEIVEGPRALASERVAPSVERLRTLSSESLERARRLSYCRQEVSLVFVSGQLVTIEHLKCRGIYR